MMVVSCSPSAVLSSLAIRRALRSSSRTAAFSSSLLKCCSSRNLSSNGTFLSSNDVSLDALKSIVEVDTDISSFDLAADVQDNVLIYEAERVMESPKEAKSEWARALMDGPGIIVIKGAFNDAPLLDAITGSFENIIASERAEGLSEGDHFAAAGSNSRIWNAFEKLAVRTPELFVPYYANPIIAMVSKAWLGPSYQITSQVNIVHPGGAAQECHRDYHLGFHSDSTASLFPSHAHMLSQTLTLQGAVAHSDMPTSLGPTLFLPHSQKYKEGYVAWRNEGVKDYFSASRVQLPLEKGDAVFFNPAVFHAAGENVSADADRVANLLQISSPMGRAMETVNTKRIVTSIYPHLSAFKMMSDAKLVENIVTAASEGYSFPTNLDLDTPIGGELAPQSQTDILRTALAHDWDELQLQEELEHQESRKRSA